MKPFVFLATTLLVLSMSRCGANQLPPPPAPIAVGQECEAAQTRLDQLGCIEAHSPKGVSFATTCHDVADAGVDVHAACIARVQSCDQVGAASRGELCE